ncbi:MAG: hypothetical protein ACI87E_001143 [Mariniblastus sp.]|jgi:hypothetical protein
MLAILLRPHLEGAKTKLNNSLETYAKLNRMQFSCDALGRNAKIQISVMEQREQPMVAGRSQRHHSHLEP